MNFQSLSRLVLVTLFALLPSAMAKTKKKSTETTQAASKKGASKNSKSTAKETSSKGSAKEVSTILTSYRSAKAIQAKVKKTITQEALGTEMKSEGVFYFSKGKLRLEIREPERSTLVYDGKVVWFETSIDETQAHVTKMRVNELKKSDSLLTALFEKKDLLNTFKFLGVTNKDGHKTYAFEPKDKKKSEVQKLDISIYKKELERITYRDQVENLVSLEFSDLDKKTKVPSDKFAYKPPEGAEVTEL